MEQLQWKGAHPLYHLIGPLVVSTSRRIAQMRANRMNFSHANIILFIFGCTIVLSERYLFEA
jgi:hypothetical protein